MISSTRPTTHGQFKKDKKFQKKISKKWICSLLFEMINYIQINSPTYGPIALISSIYFFLSITAFAYLPQCLILYPTSVLSNSIINIISTIFLLLYPGSNLNTISIVSIIIILMFFIYAIIFFIFVIYFHKKAKIPKPILIFLGLGIMLGPLFFNIVFLYISHIVADLIFNGYHHYESIIFLCIFLFIIVAYFPFYYNFLSPTLYFRPKTVIFYSSQSEKYFYLSLHLYTFLSVGFSRGTDTLYSIIVTYASLIFLILALLFFYLQRDIVLMRDYYYTMPLLETAFFMLFIVNSFRLSNYFRIRQNREIITTPTYFLFACFVFNFLLAAITRFIINLLKKKYSDELDRLDMTGIDSERQFFRLLRYGFEINHQNCYNWSLFRYGIALGTKRIMICYSKISAYYFNEEENLLYVLKYFHDQFWNEIFIKNLSYQMHSLIQSHEASLDKSLKKELFHLHRKCIRCRSLMRYMWQKVICNDLSYIDRLSLSLYTHTKSIEESYAHIMLNFSHNHFVAKSYAYFLSDVMQKKSEGKYWMEVEKSLKSGKRIKNERIQIISKHVMGKYLKETDYYITDKIKEKKSFDDVVRNLEDLMKSSKANNNHTNTSSKISSNMNNEFVNHSSKFVQIEDEHLVEEERKRNQIELLIKNVRLPSMKYMTLLVFIIFSIVIPFLIIIPFIISYNHASTSENAFLSIIQSGSLAPSFIQTIIIGYLTVLNSVGLLEPIDHNFQALNIPKELWPEGWSNETSYEMIHASAADELRKRVTNFNSLISKVSLQKYYYDSIVAPFYAQVYDYSVYDSSTGSGGNRVPVLIKNMKLSMEAILALYISLSYRVTRFHDSEKYFYAKSQDFMNIEANADTIMSNLNQYTSVIIDLALKDRKKHSDLLTSILIVTTVLIAVLPIITWIIVTYFIKKDSMKVYSILQFVPKNEINVVMHSLSQKDEDNESTDNNKGSSLKNNALRTLITPVGKYKNDWFSFVKVLVTLLIILIAGLNLGLQVYLKKVSIDSPFSASPLIFHCGKIHTQIGTVFHKILLCMSSYMMIEVNLTQLLNEIDSIINETLPNLDEFKYGSESNNFYKGINSIDSFFANSFSKKLCDWPVENLFYYNIFFCENYENSVTFILNYIRVLMESNPALDYSLFYMNPIVCWFFKNSYEQFVKPTEEYLMDMFSENVVSYQNNSAKTSIIITLVLFLIGIILTVILPRVAYPVYNCLRLLLFVDLQIIYSSKPIMKLLTNDFSKFKFSKSSKNSSPNNFDKYFDFISSMEDSVLITSNEGIVAGVNKSAARFLSNRKKTSIFQDENYQVNIFASSQSDSKKKKKKLHKKKGSQTESEFNFLISYSSHNYYESINESNSVSEESEIHDDDFYKEFGESLIGKNIIDVIQNRKFSRIFNIVQNQGFQPSFDIYLSPNESIQLTSIAVLHTGELSLSKEFATNCVAFYCFVITDRVEKTNLAKQLEEETLKCHNIISSFFPEKLVDYIQSGMSENIEIVIQSATVVFVEMVQFSPFYFNMQNIPNTGDDQTLDMLVQSNVLSKFISEIDRVVENHPKMTRIKTLGGTYMAIGGIFDNQSSVLTVSQQQQQHLSTSPQTARSKFNHSNNSGLKRNNSTRSSSSHAIDAVSFALDAINAVRMLSMELNFPIRCRAGVHTCGPLSAGIVGETNPSFEVIGNGISTALIMKDSANPMTVHITDAVCNLILSGGFKIREAENVTVGEKSLKTFIVYDYANK